MRNTQRINFLFIVGLILTFGLTTVAFAGGVNDKKKKTKRPKNTGTISIITSPNALPVKIDGELKGMSGVGEPAEFYLTPGPHTIVVEGPDGKNYEETINVVKNVKNCICLRVNEKKIDKPCPYNMVIDGPTGEVNEGEEITFTARNIASQTPIEGTALNYRWTVIPEAAFVSGDGTPTIKVNTTGLTDKTITVSVDVNDGVYDANCAQTKTVSFKVKCVVGCEPPPETCYDCFPFVSQDEIKARLDSVAIRLQSDPTSTAYIFLYQGTDARSRRKGLVEKLKTEAENYLVRQRGIAQSRIRIIIAPYKRVSTTYEVHIRPAGAPAPAPSEFGTCLDVCPETL